MENCGAKGPEGSSGLEGDSAKCKRPKLLQFTYFHFETLPIPLNSYGFENYFYMEIQIAAGCMFWNRTLGTFCFLLPINQKGKLAFLILIVGAPSSLWPSILKEVKGGLAAHSVLHDFPHPHKMQMLHVAYMWKSTGHHNTELLGSQPFGLAHQHLLFPKRKDVY